MSVEKCRFLAKTVSDNRAADRKLKATLERAMQERIDWTRKNRVVRFCHLHPCCYWELLTVI
jgi:hypothetical protein